MHFQIRTQTNTNCYILHPNPSRWLFEGKRGTLCLVCRGFFWSGATTHWVLRMSKKFRSLFPACAMQSLTWFFSNIEVSRLWAGLDISLKAFEKFGEKPHCLHDPPNSGLIFNQSCSWWISDLVLPFEPFWIQFSCRIPLCLSVNRGFDTRLQDSIRRRVSSKDIRWRLEDWLKDLLLTSSRLALSEKNALYKTAIF